MNSKKDFKKLLNEWNSFFKKPLNEGVGDTSGVLDQLDPKVAEALRNKVKQFFIFDKESFDIDEQIRTKKDVIRTILTKNKIDIPDDHIYIATNLALSTDGTTLGNIKGTSGKSTPAEQIASSRPDASGFTVYDNLARGLGEVEKGLIRAARKSNPALKAKVDRMAELSKTSAEYKKLDAEVKAAAAELNIMTMQVGEGGAAQEVHGASASKSGGDKKNSFRGWYEMRSLLYNTLLQGTKALRSDNEPIFRGIISKYPHLTYVYNDLYEHSTETGAKKGSKIDSSESPGLAQLKDLRTQYLANLVSLKKQVEDLTAVEKQLTSAGDVAGAVEIQMSADEKKSQFKEIVDGMNDEVWKFISDAKKELVSCIRDMKNHKTNGAPTFKMGQEADDVTAPEPDAAPATDAKPIVATGAEQTDKPQAQNNIKIYDFDQTLFDTRDSFKAAQIQREYTITFFMSYLNPKQKDIALKKLATSMKPLQLSKELKSDPENSYIISSVSSPGFDKGVDYFAALLAKKDEDLRKFLTVVLGKSLDQLDKMLYGSSSSTEVPATAAAEPEPEAKPEVPVEPEVTAPPKKAAAKKAKPKTPSEDEDTLAEMNIRVVSKPKTLKEQLSGLRFRLGTRR